ncbi:cyclin-T1-2-like isoform X2 [Asparagus officinalis]|nr:cyclin-T1-2-like isoform X2 [Asparagus officinalis]
MAERKMDDLPHKCRFSWYWSRQEIEKYSASRKDGVDLRKETQIRTVYCSFLQDIGKRLGVPQVTIATAMMLCHRFYLHQSHRRNEWQTIATVSMFLASKVADTPCHLHKVVKVAYETMYQQEPASARRIYQKDIFEKQKELILNGERLLLCTVRYDFDIPLPYKPLHEAFRKLKITQKDVIQTAWNFVNNWLRTTLCLQYEPSYIAAGSLYLAAKHHNMKLPTGDGCIWWQLLEIVPKQLDEILQQMMELLGYNKRPLVSPAPEKPKVIQPPVASAEKEEEPSSSPESCVLSRDGSSIRSPSHEFSEEASSARLVELKKIREAQCELRNSESPVGVVEDCREEHALNKINVDRIKALMKTRKRKTEVNYKCIQALDDSSEESWIQRELEAGIELETKRQRQV